MNDQHDAAPQAWNAVEGYFDDWLVGSDPALSAALTASEDAGLPPISVAPNQGKMLHLLARACHARTILEVGTLGGYSTIWLARALPAEGKVITLESEKAHAEVAVRNIAEAGLSDKVDVRLGKAIDTLPTLAAEGPFDLVFIDADKESNADYFSWAVQLSRPGTMVIVDNVVRGGAVANADSNDSRVQGVRRLTETIAADHRVSATAVQTVGSKGYDGFTIALVTG